jgi:hypothetical protein
MADLEVGLTPLIHLRPFHLLPSLPPSSSPQRAHNCIRECSLQWHPLRLGGMGERSSQAGPCSPAAKSVGCICDLQMKYGVRLSSLSWSGRSPAVKHAFCPQDEISGDVGIISNPSHSSPPHPLTSTPPHLPRRKRPLTALACVPWNGTHCGYVWGSAQAPPAGPGGAYLLS